MYLAVEIQQLYPEEHTLLTSPSICLETYHLLLKAKQIDKIPQWNLYQRQNKYQINPEQTQHAFSQSNEWTNKANRSMENI